MEQDNGRVPSEPGSREPSPAVSAASGFDPSRVAWLHIRGQFTYHSEAHIVGTRAGLIALRNAIDDALANREAEASVCASDGEGYSLTVRRARSPNQMGSPTYIDVMAREVFDYERKWIAEQERRNWSVYQSDLGSDA